MVSKLEQNMARRKEIGSERRERTRIKLLTAAAQVLAEYSERKVTIEDFVREAGVARGTFYNYYKTVEEIYDDLWAFIGNSPFQEIQQVCASIKAPEERFATKGRLVLRTAVHQKAWGWVIYSLSRADGNVNDDLLAYPRPELSQGLKTGGFDFKDIESANDLAVGTLRGALYAVLREEQQPDYAEAICRMLLRALGVEPERADEIVDLPMPKLVKQHLTV